MGVIEENLFIFLHILLGFMKFLDDLLDRLNAMWNWVRFDKTSAILSA